METLIFLGIILLSIIITKVLNAFFNTEGKGDSMLHVTDNSPEPDVEDYGRLMPENAIVFMEGLGMMSGKQLDDMRIGFQKDIGRIIKTHFRKLRKLTPGDKPLGFIIKSAESLIPVICDKMSLAVRDGRGHSFGISDVDSNTLVSISCWPCGLGELRSCFESQYGSYINALSNYIEKAASLGFQNFIHLFFCYSDTVGSGKFGSTGVTATYFNPVSCIFMKPDELISDYEIEKFKNGY